MSTFRDHFRAHKCQTTEKTILKVKSRQKLSTLFCKLNLSINEMRECKLKYFEVELENPDEFLKLQTEDFVKANRLLLRKIIQSVTVYEEHFVISFKSGIELEV